MPMSYSGCQHFALTDYRQLLHRMKHRTEPSGLPLFICKMRLMPLLPPHLPPLHCGVKDKSIRYTDIYALTVTETASE